MLIKVMSASVSLRRRTGSLQPGSGDHHSISWVVPNRRTHPTTRLSEGRVVRHSKMDPLNDRVGSMLLKKGLRRAANRDSGG